MPFLPSTGDKIRQAREARGWSQRTLGDKIGISQVAIQKIEAGDTNQSKHLPLVARVLGIDLADLVPGLSSIDAADASALTLAFLHFIRAEHRIDVPERHFETLRSILSSAANR